jgi:hypothetical protein
MKPPSAPRSPRKKKTLKLEKKVVVNHLGDLGVLAGFKIARINS